MDPKETRTAFVERRVREGLTHCEAEAEATALGLIYGPGEYIPVEWDGRGVPCRWQSWERLMSE